MSASTKHKTQILLNESQGTQVRENVHKFTANQNTWQFLMASCPEEAAPVSAVSKISANDLLALIREHMY